MAVRKTKGVAPAAFRRLALALAEVSEVPHFDRIAFRTPRRIFATLSGDGVDVNFMLEPEHQAIVVAAQPHAFQPVQGGWGRMGATRCELARVTTSELEPVLVEAHRRASAPRAKAKVKVRASAKPKR